MPTKVKFAPWRISASRVPSETGSPTRPVFSSYFDDEGRIHLEKVGEENVYDSIQSFAESVDINTILARYTAGDTEVLNRVQGFYFDVTEVPKNAADLLNKLNRAEEGFEKMPAEFKEKFGNDFARFICTFDPSEFMKVVENPQIVGNLPKTSSVAKEGDESES